MKKALLLGLALCFISAQVFAGSSDSRRTQLKLLGLYDMSKMVFGDAAVQALVADAGAPGGGLLLEFPLGKVVGFEIGGLYQPYSYKLSSAAISTDLTTTWNYIHVPVAFRFHLGSVVSLGVGGYYNSAMGKMKVSGTVAGADVSAEADVDSSAKTDYGLLAALGFNFRLGSRVHLILEGRYLSGMKDLSSSGGSAKVNHIQAMGGFGIGL